MSSATALLADAETSIKAGEWDQALEQLENLKKDQPSQPEVYEKLAHVLAVRGKFQSVISTYLELVRILVEAENLEKADGMVTKVLELRPESGEARERRIEIENKRGNVARAVYLSRELARLCIDQGDGERSIRLLQDALKHEPGNLDIALELAEMFVSHGHIQDGANQYRKVANAFQAAGNIAKAAEAYRRMKVVQSDDPEVLLTLGRLYTELGKLDEAEQEFRSVLRHDLDHEQALLQLGLVCQLKGRFRSGILAFNKVLQNNPNLVIAKRKLGELHHSQGMMTEAVDFFLQAAQGHLEADVKEEAIECFQIVLSVDENNAPAQQGLTNLGAPVCARTFEPPQPPVPVEEDTSTPEPPPPPPVPFAPAPPTVPTPAPEPVGGSAIATERTERLQPINFDPPGAETEPPKPEATPKRPIGAGSTGLTGGTAGASAMGGNKRVGLTGMSMKQGLVPGGDKPMLGDKPTLGRPGLVRPGLDRKSMGGGPGATGDKPMLGVTGPGDRRPQLGASRAEPAPPAPAGVSGGKGSFVNPAPLEEFAGDMDFDIFADSPSSGPAAQGSVDDDFTLPEASFFKDPVSDGAASLSIGHGAGDLFDSSDDMSSAGDMGGGPKIGSFSGFDSDEDSSGAASSLRPTYAQDAQVEFGDDAGDDLFNFDPDPDGPHSTISPTLSSGGLFDDDGGGGGDLFDDAPGDDLFGGGAQSQGALKIGGAGLFDDDSGSSKDDQGMFGGDSDPFENLFDEPVASEKELASETIGGSKPVAPDLVFDPEPSGAVSESSFGSLFDEPEDEPKAIPLSVGDDLFGAAEDDFFSDPDSTPQATFAPTISAEPDDGLFGNDLASNDLFGDDDMFGGSEASGLNPGFSNPATSEQGLYDSGSSDLGGGDLFSGPGDNDFDLGGGLGLDAPIDDGQGFESEGLFGDDIASDGLFEASEEGDGMLQGASDGAGLFGADDPSDGGLFGGSDFGGEDFASNGATALAGDGLFGGDLGEPVAASASDGGLFDGLDSGSDTLFDGFDSGEVAEPAALAGNGGLFGGDEHGESNQIAIGGDTMFESSDGGLFGDPDGGLFGEPEAASTTAIQADDYVGGDSLFGDYPSQEEERDDLRLPLSASSDDDDLFRADDGSQFDLPDPSEPGTLVEARSIEEPVSISIPEPPSDSLFGDEEASDNLFGRSMEFDAPPLELDLPMPDDPPMFSDSAGDFPSSAEPFNNDGGALFTDESDTVADLFADEGGFDAPLSIDIPEPSDESHGAAHASIPVPEALASPEETFAPEEPEPEAAEFMAMLELTMPKAEEEVPPPPPAPEPIFIPEAPPEESFDISVSFGIEDDFEPSIELMPSVELEPAPVFEEPIPVEPDPADLLSAEEKLEIAHAAQADNLEASLGGADAASKIAAYRKVLEENPDNLVLRTRLADIHLKYGLLEDAVVQYRQVMRRNPDSIPLLHSVIQAEFWNENYVEAGDSLLALAQLHLKRGQQHEALDTLQSVLSLDPLHFEARKELVRVFTALDDSKLAAHHLRQLAETALTKGEVAGAISAFQQLLEISADPTFEERLAQIYEGQGDVAKALSSFQSLVGRYRAEERWEEAARVTERIVELDPSQLGDREALIALYQRLGHAGQAVEQQFQLARRYQERNETERAISLYEEVLKYQVDNHDARRHLVDAYLDAGRVSAALEQAESLTEHYLDTKDHNTAIYMYSRLVDADPESVELQERLVKFYGLAGDPENAKSRWIHISNLHERNGRYDRAAEAVQKALELDESQIDLQHRLALLYADRLADNQSALGQLRKLFQMAPGRMDAVKMYIDLLLKEEQVSEAGQVLQRLEQAGGESVEIKANVIALLKASVEGNPNDLKARFNYGELCYHLGDLDHAIEQFQQTRRHPDFELISYNMLGLCFASKRGYMMLDLAIKQFQKGLETKGRPEQDYLETRYNLAMVQYQNGRAKDALAELKECYNVDIAYRDVRSWIQKIEGELASGS